MPSFQNTALPGARSRTVRQLLRAALATAPAFACAQGGGLGRVQDGLNQIQAAMLGISAVIITIAIIWAGWQLLYEGKRFSDIARIFFGAILIGAAPGLGAMFV